MRSRMSKLEKDSDPIGGGKSTFHNSIISQCENINTTVPATSKNLSDDRYSFADDFGVIPSRESLDESMLRKCVPITPSYQVNSIL